MNVEVNERFDFVFSWWIFTWYLLYELKVIKYNPKLAVFLGLMENIIVIMVMLFYKNSVLQILLFTTIITFIKVIPLYTLKNTPYHRKDTYFFIFLFLLYLLWLFYNKVNLYNLKIIEKIKQDKPFAPLVIFINKKLLLNN